MTATLRRYWISWVEPSADPRPARDWKDAPDWWCSGSTSSQRSIICAVVDAKTPVQAKTLVGKFWDPSEWRFCTAQADGWMPPADRFPPRKAVPR